MNKENPPAFPKTPFVEIGTPQNGMTMRDYFAAKAMQALLNSDEWRESLGESDASKFTAFSAYSMADAMMEARKE
jgi:hypothetical protein